MPLRWADQLLSVHMIEHIAPAELPALLRHWHDLLVTGGVVTIHTPNGQALGELLAGDPEPARYWAAQSAIYGYSLHPKDADRPESFSGVAEHRVLLTFDALRGLLEEAGFRDVEDVTGRDSQCHHQRDWAFVVPRFCLEVQAAASHSVG
jgi:predicted SAM-dependent methyltransferase